MRHRMAVVAASLAALLVVAAPASARHEAAATAPTRLVTGLAGGFGSTIGPDGALYVTEWHASIRPPER